MISIRLRKGSVDGDRLTAALERRLPFLDLDRDVPVDDQPPGRVDSEFGKHLVAKRGLVNEGKIGVLRLVVGGGIGDEIALEGRDPVLAKQRRQGTAPQVPQLVEVALRRTVDRLDQELFDRDQKERPPRYGTLSKYMGRNSPFLFTGTHP